jgi:hypothetical protein
MRCLPRALVTLLLLAAIPALADPADMPKPAGIVSRIKHLPVDSSALATVGYSKRRRVLEIEFRNGAIYRYFEVAPSVFHALLDAPSKARFYDQNIRRKYRSVHVRPRVE